MSHINFDFLTDSILFGSNLEDDFEALNEGILREELARCIFHLSSASFPEIQST